MRYVHLPTEVDAVQWTGGDFEVLPAAWRASGAFQLHDRVLLVVTARGLVEAEIGDYIVRSKWGEYWPVKEPVFLSNYKAVTT